MGVLNGVSDFFGLDIGTSAIRVVQLHGKGPVKALVKYGLVPVDPNVVLSDAKIDQQKVAAIIKELVDQVKLTTKNVAVGLPSQRVFTAVVDVDRLSKAELGKSILYQADTLIPTPIADSKVDWAYLGDSPKDSDKVEILLSSVSSKYVEERLDILEGVGLNVVAFEPDTLALARSVYPNSSTTAALIIDMGLRVSDLVVTTPSGPRLMRSIPTGSESILKSAVQNLNIDHIQAEQFVYKFGLNKDKLEGQIYNAIIGTVDVLVSDIEKSIKFYNGRYPNSPIDRIIVTGGASTLPEFPLYIANKFGINVEIGNAWCNISYPDAIHNELMAVSNHFGVAVGLAERSA